MQLSRNFHTLFRYSGILMVRRSISVAELSSLISGFSRQLIVFCRDESAKNLVIRAESSFHDSGGVILRVADIIKHENFDPDQSKDYDYGLIQLSRSFGRAVVANLKNGPRRFQPSVLCQVMGWGRTSHSEVSKRVQSIAVPVVKQSVCRAAYTWVDTITPRMLCAGYSTGSKDACEGDSGGPLICRGMLTGITSWAEGCAEKGFYGVYSYITPVRLWIRSKTGI
ncbi:trypsin-1-like isoform X1 [Armigeres subalbatus]|uniref:trypsin-1-like isoform X1 n=1 Tax=Armigeres subalbatus TaxID=124917 RepID=UPI002ED0991E